MPLDRIVDLGFFVAASALVLLLLPPTILDLRTYLGTGARRQKDSTGRVPAPGPEVGARIEVLEGLGYRRLGETSTPLPSGEVPGWILTTEDGSTYAILTAAPAPEPGLTGFY